MKEATELGNLDVIDALGQWEAVAWGSIVAKDVSSAISMIREDPIEAMYCAGDAAPEKMGPESGGHQPPWVHNPEQWEAMDDVRGGKLSLQKVIDARVDEMAFIKKRKVYIYSTYEEAFRVTGKRPLGVRWVDTDKGDRIRSRLCAQEFRRKWEEAIFAGTPPLEALRILVVVTAMNLDAREPLCMLLLDVKKAHFYAPTRRRVFIKLPEEVVSHLCAEN